MIGYSFHPQAEEEVLEIAQYYEARSPGLGKGFRSELDSVIQFLRRLPEAAPVVRGNLRRKFLNRFPYLLIYAVEFAEVRIYAVSHRRRRPDYWVSRLPPG